MSDNEVKKKIKRAKNLFTSAVRTIMHDTLFLICMALSVGTFISFGINSWTNIIMAVVAMVFESTKLYTLLKAKEAYRDNKKVIIKVLYTSLYSIFAFISLICSVMFALNVISIKSKMMKTVMEVTENTITLQADNFDEEINFWKSEMDRVQEEIDTLTNAVDRADGNFGTSITKISENKPQLKEEKEKYTQKWLEAKEAKLSFQQSLNSGNTDQETKIKIDPGKGFEELAISLNRIFKRELFTVQQIQIYLFLLIMLMLEISVALTSGNLPEESAQSDDKIKLTTSASAETKEIYRKVITAMFEGINSNRLNSVNKTAEITGFDPKICLKVKTSLISMRFRGKPILYIEGRKTQTRFKKDNLITVVNHLLDKPNDETFIPEF